MARGPNASCPACGGPAGASVGTQGGFEWLACAACGTRYVGIRPTQDELREFYDRYYAPKATVVPDAVRASLAAVLRGFASHRRTGRLLDVGFGEGLLLEAAAAQGWECWGTELSDVALERARAKGWHVAPDVAGLEADDFDVIAMVEVLEHLDEPAAEVRRVVPRLRAGGLVHVTTPHGRGLSSRLYGSAWPVFAAPEHLQLLSGRGVRALLEPAGLRIDQLAAEGLDGGTVSRLRRGGRGGLAVGHERVAAGYALQEALGTPSGRMAKRCVNAALRISRLGDTLKVQATGG